MFGTDLLTEAQQEAVEHGSDPLLILAGAGTGKTKTLAARVAHLLETGVPPERICLLTFSRRAAQELLTRAGATAPAASRVWGGTFHAVANRMLRRHGHLVGLDPSFTVLDQGDAADVLGLVRQDLGHGGEKPGAPRLPRKDTLAAIGSRVVNTQQPLTAVVAEHYPWCTDHVEGIKECLLAAMARRREHQVLDFDDLLLYWRALGPGPLADAFDHVLVDEFQDTNTLQADILDLLCPDGKGLTVVGDDAQAIYAFRAATAENILRFPSRYPDVRVVLLDRNHRSTPPVLAVANAIIADAPQEHSFRKQLVAARSGPRRPVLRRVDDETAQARVVCDRILELRDEGVMLREQAVLFRATHHADVLELELGRRQVPYAKYGGLKFLEAAHVKDLLSLVRVLDNPTDEVAWFRVLQLLDGVGPATARRLASELSAPAAPGEPAVSTLSRLLAAAPRVPSGAAEAMSGLREAFGDCADMGASEAGAEPSAGPEVERLTAYLLPIIGRRYDAPASRLADLDALVLMAGQAPSRARFLADLTLDPPVSTGDMAGAPHLDDDWLTLSTVHSAKGMEFGAVHIIHAADGMFPSDLATGSVAGIEEERRLLYVACTRARDILEITVPLRYHHFHQPRGRKGDQHSYAQLSRFLTEAVRSHLDEVSVTSMVADAPSGVPSGAAAIRAVDDSLAALFSS